MKNKKKNLRKASGITLIALVITIVVLIILATVSINMILNDDGIIGAAEKAKEKYQNAASKEQEDLADMEGELNKHIPKVYNVGDVVKLKNTKGEGAEDDIEEEFYVIKDEGDTVILLSKYNIKKDGENWIQDTTGENNQMPFSSTNYWSSATITNDSLNLNTYVPSDTTQIKDKDAIKVAGQYASKIDNTNGRLMTLEEIEALGGSREEFSTEECPSWINTVKNANEEEKSMFFWLGSAGNTKSVWYVIGEERQPELLRL